MKRISGYICDYNFWNPSFVIPIWIYEINENDFFPVKFEYKQREYKGLRFSARLSEVEY